MLFIAGNVELQAGLEMVIVRQRKKNAEDPKTLAFPLMFTREKKIKQQKRHMQKKLIGVQVDKILLLRQLTQIIRKRAGLPFYTTKFLVM